MDLKFLDIFRLHREKEDFDVVYATIKNSSSAAGTNLWILFFAILIASLGLNVNSTAVVIGAMLISPLIGPIVGLGFAVSIKDYDFVKIAFRSYIISTVIGLVASTIYFLISPISNAHSEILARTTPSIYDVLIALFGGFAGVIALSSRQKGNVLPGVAIATAIMPPLCTAGYGIATWQLNFFVGAFYLFLINSVFIFAATLVTSHFLKFPKKKYVNEQLEKREKLVTWGIIVVTLLPSIYLGYVFVDNNNFRTQAEKFIQNEALLPDDYLLNSQINPDQRLITLTYVGNSIDSADIKKMKSMMPIYSLKNTKLSVEHSFSFDKKNPKDGKEEKFEKLKAAYQSKVEENSRLLAQKDSVSKKQLFFDQVVREVKIIWPNIDSGILNESQTKASPSDSTSKDPNYLVVFKARSVINTGETKRLNEWLKERLSSKNIDLILR